MEILKIFLFFVLAISCEINAVNPRKSSFARGARIIKGQVAAPGQFPFIVALDYKGVMQCAGSIISRNEVVTAEHCIYKFRPNLSEFRIRAGILKQSEVGVVRYIASAELFEYDPVTMAFDITVLRLKTFLDFNDLIKPIAIYRGDKKPAYFNATVIGWGKTGQGKPISEDLMYIETMNHEDESCANVWIGQFYRTQYCFEHVVCNVIKLFKQSKRQNYCSKKFLFRVTLVDLPSSITNW